MRKITRVGVVSVATAAAVAAVVSPAKADLAPSAADYVGVGSDTVQNILNFVADGDTAGNPGFNASVQNRLVTFDATPDANDRAGYLNGSTSAALKPLNPTIVLRQGTNPVARPNGSSSGITALLADNGSARKLDFVRASRAPKASELATANDNSHLYGGLRTVQIATDPLQAAVATTTNAPAAISVAQLVDIYKCNTTSFAAIGGTGTGAIIPLIPQSGSGTRSTFEGDLKAANGNVAVTLGSCVQTVEENDPTSITGSTSPANTIAPFSGGRLNLFNAGYFKDPATGATLTPGVKLVGAVDSSGTVTDGSYQNIRPLYVIFRGKDENVTTAFQPGSTKNAAQALFIRKGTSRSFVESAGGQTLIASGGVNPLYNDKGNAFSVG